MISVQKVDGHYFLLFWCNFGFVSVFRSPALNTFCSMFSSLSLSASYKGSLTSLYTTQI